MWHLSVSQCHFSLFLLNHGPGTCDILWLVASVEVDLGWSMTRHGSRAVWVTWCIGGCPTSSTVSGDVSEAGEWWSEFQIIWIMNHKSWCLTLCTIAVLYATWLLLLFPFNRHWYYIMHSINIRWFVLCLPTSWEIYANSNDSISITIILVFVLSSKTPMDLV